MEIESSIEGTGIMIDFKLGHLEIQNRPLGDKIGQYPISKKEHIANTEQIVYGIFIVDPTVPAPPAVTCVVGGSNPGHKERDT